MAVGKQRLLEETLVVVLAGGAGERLHPLTRDRAKPAVPFGGSYRIIDFTLSNCLNSNLRRICVLTQYKSFSLNRHITLGWQRFNVPELGQYIDLIPPQHRVGHNWYLGTADAIFQNVYTLERERPAYVLILAGDHIYKMDYAEMLHYHVAQGAVLTVACVEVEKEKAQELGIAAIAPDRKIIGFQEKPKDNPATLPGDPGHCLASMGIYVFDTESLVRRVTADAKENTEHDFGKNIIPGMVQRGEAVYAYSFREEEGKRPGYWRDVGTIDAYWEANMDLCRVTPQFNLYDERWPVRTRHEDRPPAKFVFAGGENPQRVGHALNAIVSPGCIVSGGCVEHSVLSPGVRVHSYAHVAESVLLEGVSIGRRCRIRRAIIDKDVDVPENTVIGYDPQEDRKRFTVTAGGIAVVPKGMSLVQAPPLG